MTADIRKQVLLRLDPELLHQIDERIEQVNARKARDGEKEITRTEWFVNMADWVINHLPHQADTNDWAKASPYLPEGARMKPATREMKELRDAITSPRKH